VRATECFIKFANVIKKNIQWINLSHRMIKIEEKILHFLLSSQLLKDSKFTIRDCTMMSSVIFFDMLYSRLLFYIDEFKTWLMDFGMIVFFVDGEKEIFHSDCKRQVRDFKNPHPHKCLTILLIFNEFFFLQTNSLVSVMDDIWKKLIWKIHIFFSVN
jgi:hypothetical protein